MYEILPFPYVYILECITFVKKQPDIFVQHIATYSYDTRNKNKKLVAPKTRLKLVDKGPYCKCILLYNKLPDNIKSIENIFSFKNEVKKY